jgi:hypothetical protein
MQQHNDKSGKQMAKAFIDQKAGFEVMPLERTLVEKKSLKVQGQK